MGILQQHAPEVLHGEATLPWAEYDTVHSVLINAGETFRHWGRWSDMADLFRQSLVVAERHEDLRRGDLLVDSPAVRAAGIHNHGFPGTPGTRGSARRLIRVFLLW